VIDSLGEPPRNYQSEFIFDGIYTGYVSHDERDPIGHGTAVFDILASLCSDATYSIFQVIEVEQNGDNLAVGGNRAETAQAVADAAESGVDMLNMSVGIPHDCDGLCVLSREVELAKEVDDVCIVVAAGNQEKEPIERIGVHCPALSESTISVAGYLPNCTADIDTSDESQQWWVENETIHGPFCGQQGGCTGDRGCENNRNEVLWEGNVSFHNEAPDVVAPVLEVSGTALDEVRIQAGTSFAAPLVTASLASIVADLAAAEVEPSADEIQAAVQYKSQEIDDGGYHKLDAGGVWDFLADE